MRRLPESDTAPGSRGPTGVSSTSHGFAASSSSARPAAAAAAPTADFRPSRRSSTTTNGAAPTPRCRSSDDRGCLGPCALANVVLLLFDGHALWFHSVNADPLVLILY